MNNEPSTSEYILLFRGTQWDKGLSPEEIQKILGQFYGWIDQLTQDGKFKVGQPLANEGKVVSGKKGRAVADGPFAESKETVGGYFILQVADLDEAVQIAQQCPILEYGAKVEVRPIAAQCATSQRVNELLAEATV